MDKTFEASIPLHDGKVPAECAGAFEQRPLKPKSMDRLSEVIRLMNEFLQREHQGRKPIAMVVAPSAPPATPRRPGGLVLKRSVSWYDGAAR